MKEEPKPRYAFVGNGVTKLITDRQGYSKLYSSQLKRKTIVVQERISVKKDDGELKSLIKELKEAINDVKNTFSTLSTQRVYGQISEQKTSNYIDIDEKIVVSSGDDISSIETPNNLTTTKEVQDNSIEATRNKLRKLRK